MNIENHRNSWFTHWKWFCPSFFVCLPGWCWAPNIAAVLLVNIHLSQTSLSRPSHNNDIGAFPEVMGIPGYLNSWMVSMENPIYKWMMTRGSPILGNHHTAWSFWKVYTPFHPFIGIRLIFRLNIIEYPHNIWPYMVLTYLHFRVLKIPLMIYRLIFSMVLWFWYQGRHTFSRLFFAIRVWGVNSDGLWPFSSGRSPKYIWKIRETTPKSIIIHRLNSIFPMKIAIIASTIFRHRTSQNSIQFSVVSSCWITICDNSNPHCWWHLHLQRFRTNQNQGPLCSTSAGTGRHLARPPQELLFFVEPQEESWLGDLPSQKIDAIDGGAPKNI